MPGGHRAPAQRFCRRARPGGRHDRHVRARPGHRCLDRALPLLGWELPGVYTAGAAQALAKGQRVAVGNQVLVAGTERQVEIDAVCVGYGYPAARSGRRRELCRPPRCGAGRRGTAPTAPGVFAADQLTGIRGAELAAAEGAVARTSLPDSPVGEPNRPSARCVAYALAATSPPRRRHVAATSPPRSTQVYPMRPVGGAGCVTTRSPAAARRSATASCAVPSTAATHGARGSSSSSTGSASLCARAETADATSPSLPSLRPPAGEAADRVRTAIVTPPRSEGRGDASHPRRGSPVQRAETGSPWLSMRK